MRIPSQREGALSDPPNLADLVAILPPVELLDGLPAEALPAALAYLLALQARVVARMASNGTPCRPAHEPAAVRYVTQAEAAALFNIPLSTVRHLTRRGRVPALGRGKNRRLLPADLARELEDCKRTGRALRPSGARAARKPLTGPVPVK